MPSIHNHSSIKPGKTKKEIDASKKQAHYGRKTAAGNAKQPSGMQKRGMLFKIKGHRDQVAVVKQSTA
jgi:hypothetical protein